MGEPVSVSVIALDPMLEAGAISALHRCPDVAVAEDGRAEVTVVIVDAIARDTFDVVRATHNAEHRPDVVLIAAELAPTEALHGIAAGARGLLRRREADPARLARTVLAVASGDCIVPPDMLDLLIEGTPGTGSAAALTSWSTAGISERERAVLSLVAEGNETDEIAKTLCYSPRTVVSIVHDITQRFRLRNRAHAVAYALRAGLL